MRVEYERAVNRADRYQLVASSGAEGNSGENRAVTSVNSTSSLESYRGDTVFVLVRLIVHLHDAATLSTRHVVAPSSR